MLPKTNYPKSNFVDIFSARFNLGKHLRFATFLEIGLDLGVVIAVHSENKWCLVLTSSLQNEQIRLKLLNIEGVASLKSFDGVPIIGFGEKV